MSTLPIEKFVELYYNKVEKNQEFHELEVHMGSVKIRDVAIGEGCPKICVPIIAKSLEEIKKAAIEIKEHAFDMVEWRADFFEAVSDMEKVDEALTGLREILGNVPLLFTFRTRREGGNSEISIEDYLALNLHVCKKAIADLVDVEIFLGDDVTYLIIEAAHQSGVKVIASNHDFTKTPKKEEIIMRLCRMQEMEADIAKIAVMPVNPRDVLVLLDATLAMQELHSGSPVVTMAMGEVGAVSRLSGATFGSAVTFGCVGDSSAPGQIPADGLKEILDILSKKN